MKAVVYEGYAPNDDYKSILEVKDVPDPKPRGVSGAQASAQASEADLASARLSAVGTLASAYFQLREADAEIDLLQATVEGYERSLEIARNRYGAGVVAQTDVLQAQTQLANAQADLATVRQNRARFEHTLINFGKGKGITDAVSGTAVYEARPARA